MPVEALDVGDGQRSLWLPQVTMKAIYLQSLHQLEILEV